MRGTMSVNSFHKRHPTSRTFAYLCSTALTGVALLSFASASAQAQVVWQGDVDGNLNNASNWVGDAVPIELTGVFDNTGTAQNAYLSDVIILRGLEFATGAPGYRLSINGGGLGLLTGIVNNSGQWQTIDINSGSMQLGLGAAVGQVVINNSGLLQFDGSSDASGATVVNNGTIGLRGTFGAAALSIGSLSGTGNLGFADVADHNVELGALGLDDAVAGTIGSYDGVGDGSVTKIGAGTLTLSGNNNYWGGTMISAGTIVAASDNALGSGLVTLGGGALSLGGSPTLANDIDLAAAGTIHFIAGASGTLNGGIATNGQVLTLNTLGTGTVNGDIDGSTSLIAKSGSDTLIVNGVVSGAGANISAGSGTLVLNTANTYGGSTAIGNATLVIGNDRALSSSLLSINAAGSVLSVNKDVSLANNVSLVGGFGLTIDTAGHGLAMSGIFQTLSTAAPLTKTGTGTLTLSGDNSAFTSNAIVSEGRLDITGKLGSNDGRIEYTGSDPDGIATVRIAGSDANWTSASLSVGHDRSGGLIIESGGHVSSSMAAVAGNIGGRGSVTVSGAGSRWESSTLTSIGHYGNGSLVIEGGGNVVSSGMAMIGGATYGIGSVEISGSGSLWTSDTLSVGLQGSGTLTLAAGGRVSVTGSTLDLASQAGSFGTLNIGAASGETARAAGRVDAASVTFGSGTGTLAFNHTGNPDGSGLVFSSSLIGQGTILHESGTTSLTGDNSGFTGRTTVSGGTLLVNNTLGSVAATLVVDAGGTLGGSGTVGGSVTVSGILSAGNSPGTLTVNGDLVLNGGSTSVFELNRPGAAGGTGASGNDLVRVGGDLSLGGTLDARAAAAGYYRLFDYDGTLSGTFAGATVTGTGGFSPIAPSNPDIRYDVPGQVNLAVLGAGQTMQFWDGGDNIGNGAVDGGAGTWTGFGTNWTDATGSANGGWGGSVGVFRGAAGDTVTVDGTQSFDTLQFSTDGYMLTGGALALTPASGTAGTLSVDNGVSATIGSIIADGTGTVLKKVGGGTLILTGINSYTGGTQLGGGTLSVSSDANLGAASGDLTFDGGSLQNSSAFATARNITLNAGGGMFETDAGLTLTGVIAGIGALTKTGIGTLTIAGTNTYEGGTTLEYGSVIARADGALGNGPVLINGPSGNTQLVFEGAGAGELAITVKDGWLGFGNGASAADATIYNNTSYDSVVFYDNATAGSATIINNSGGVAFYGTTDAGSATIVNGAGGYAFFTGNSTADRATIASTAGGRIDVSQLAAAGIGIGSLSGDGTVSLGGKTLTLGGLGKDDTIGGAIKDGGSNGGAGGSLIKIGAGTLTLNGVSTYTGLTTVEDGTLIVGDYTHADAVLAGAVDVNAGGTLGGSGTVGRTTIASGATIAPGNSIGTLTINGDISFAAGSTYEAEINAAFEGDLIDASGAATINGGTVHAVKMGGVYTPGSRWTIIGADGGVTGTFDALIQNMPFVDLALAYDSHHVYIDATRNNVAFCDVAATFNQCSTGDGLETAGTGNPVYDAVAALPDEMSARQALDGLSGEIHASVKSALIEDSAHIRDAATARIRAAFEGVAAMSLPVIGYGPDGAEIAPSSTDRFAAWGRAFGSWGSFDSDGNAAELDRRVGGLLMGMDGLVAESWRLGLIAGYSHSSFDVRDRSSSGSSDSYHLGVYAGRQWGNLGLRSGLAYTWNDVETSRTVFFPGFADRLAGDYSAGTFQAFGELGYKIDTVAASFEPFANLAYVRMRAEGFAEEGGAAALRSHGQTTDATVTTLGLRAASDFDLGGLRGTARAMLGWRHAFGDTTPLSTHAFAGSDAFTVAGAPIARDAAVIEAGLDLNLAATTTLGVVYQSQIASEARQHGFNAKLNVRF